MEKLGSVLFSDIKRESVTNTRRSCCAISSTDLIAFTAPRCYKYSLDPRISNLIASQPNEDRPALPKQSEYSVDYGGTADTVFIASLDRPWSAHLMSSTEFEIKFLVWDDSGYKLLICDASGQIFIWQMLESMINKWTLTHYTRNLFGDDVLMLKWKPAAPQVLLRSDLKTKPVDFRDKFENSAKTHHIRYFEGRSVEHWIAVTSSGMVMFGFVQSPKMEMIVNRVSLSYLEDRNIVCADCSLTNNGDILLACSTGNPSDPIRVYQLTLKIESRSCIIIQTDTCKLSSTCITSLYADNHELNDRIQNLNFTQHDGKTSLLVTLIKNNGSAEIQQWRLIPSKLTLHPAFQTPRIYSEPSIEWLRQTSVQLTEPPLLSVSTPYLTNGSVTPCGLAAVSAGFVCSDHTLRLTGRESISELISIPLNLDSPTERLMAIAFSGNSTICVGLSDKFKLYIYGDTQISNERIVTLLERCIITGNSYQDVLMAIKTENLEKIWASFETDYNQQPAGIRYQLHTQFNVLKANFSMLGVPVNTHCCDILTSIQIEAAYNIFMSSICRSDYDEMDKSIEDQLNDLFIKTADKQETDLNKLLSQLDRMHDFLSEEVQVSVVQPVVQWVVDLCMHILSSLPNSQLDQSTSYWISKEARSLRYLQILLLITRLWYDKVPRCRPFLSCSIGFDPFSRMFKLLTQLQSCVSENKPLPDSLLDECSVLPNQMVLPPFEKSFGWRILPVRLTVNSAVSRYSFGDEGDYINCVSLPYGQYKSGLIKDVFTHRIICHHVQTTDRFKKCTRCLGFTVQTRSGADQKTRSASHTTPSHCICGGFWISTFIS